MSDAPSPAIAPPVDKIILRLKAYRTELNGDNHPFAQVLNKLVRHSNSGDYLLVNLKQLVRVMDGEFDGHFEIR